MFCALNEAAMSSTGPDLYILFMRAHNSTKVVHTATYT